MRSSLRFNLVAVVLLFGFGASRVQGSDLAVALPDATCAATITHSTSQTITLGNSVACSNGDPNYYHFDTSYWRSFNMATFAGSQQYNVTSVSFAVESARSGSGSQPVSVRLHLNSGGGFPGGVRTQIAATNITVSDQTQTIVNVPLIAVVPAGTSELVMEVFTPIGIVAGNTFIIGTN